VSVPRARRATALLAAGVLALGGAAAGCGEDDVDQAADEIQQTGEDAAKELEQAGEDAGKELEEAGEDAGEKLDEARDDADQALDDATGGDDSGGSGGE